MEEADLAHDSEFRMYYYAFEGLLKACYHQYRTYKSCVTIWSDAVNKVEDDMNSIPLLRTLIKLKVGKMWAPLGETQQTIVEQIEELPREMRNNYTPAFIKIAEDVFGEFDQARWPTEMALVRALRKWDHERKVAEMRARHMAPSPSSGLPLAGSGQRRRSPDLLSSDAAGSFIDSSPSKKQRTSEVDSTGALPRIIVTPPAAGDRHPSVFFPSDDCESLPNRLLMPRLELDSKENQASGRDDPTAPQTKIKTEPDAEHD
ncbi:hypothetical protein IWX48DRAFT_677168 [Phyllosticta citricarpa]